MSILVNKDTRLVVQGITGREGAFHTEQMIAYGTKVVAGVTPGKGGGWAVGNVPIFDSVHEAVAATGANTSIIYVPAKFAPDAILEAADAGVALIVCITEGVPALDMLKVRAYLDHTTSRLIGPNCPGLITPGEAKVGIMPGHIHTRGRRGRGQPLRYLDVRGRLRVDAARDRPVYRGGHRRRPDQRHQLRGLPGDVRE